MDQRKLIYAAYRLKFLTPVHIGPDNGQNPLHSSGTSLHSDTFFSALCVEASHQSDQAVESLIENAEQNHILLSDLFPYRNDELFLPKPMILDLLQKMENDRDNRKRLKRLPYIPLSLWERYLQFDQMEDFLDECEGIVSNIAFPDQRQRVQVSCQSEETSEPYFVQATRFHQGCGLYCVMGFADGEIKKQVEAYLELLGWTGIGGKRSSGWGKFQFTPMPLPEKLEKMVRTENAKQWVTLNTSLPSNYKVAETGYYTVCRRGGFVHQQDYKKQTVYAFSPGSSFSDKFEGVVKNVAPSDKQPAYRMLKPLFLGVEV
ncbi:type III-A CRISPR-associated RAMP protein Csm4 [Clostridium facile]|uniref:CRISPR system Cms protein Csm4 n=1 Tax=Clostridium facile TaxID=2763035 RepID=A0ABR7IP95_9CLOT|nr:type III-A CRISPR-associated RAMP protein Csm4 [Clostridium facile]MBC5786952.1 type III-A CRISPR-associated RAMP protein Csm4 [Clostridium facile]